MSVRVYHPSQLRSAKKKEGISGLSKNTFLNRKVLMTTILKTEPARRNKNGKAKNDA